MGFGCSGGERTRFPCLATVRCIVATLVGALTVAVVVMVITVGLRPENVYIWILHGHVEATVLVPESPDTSAGPVVRGRARVPVPSVRRGPFGDIIEPIHGSAPPGPPPVSGGRVAAVANGGQYMDLRFSLSANNPSGRVDIYAENITIHVLVSPYNNLTEMVEISRLPLAVAPFILRRQSTHTIQKRAAVSDVNTLSYIRTRYPKKTSFKVVLQVDLFIFSATALMKNTSRKLVSHYCWPVVVGEDPPNESTGPKGCTWAEDLEYPVYFSPLPVNA